ncbi:cytochrome P450 [Karstenula rhodostoma CBS 690.94]|uniref:Cytochrome P450 n=1 Tax=Karstenula rhodostoma CBS 690.94 TaxID=1392251 RepID=A0A9P4PH57_9PLEO|nr:cytochrome P450 [Karstenula rhodostoma CBS 690.94]
MADLLRSKTVAAALGLFTHFITNSGECDHHVHLLVPGGTLLFEALVALEYVADPRVFSLFQAFQVVATAATVYLGTLTASIVIYRAQFHRLRKFPGPFAARITKFDTISRVLPDCQLYKVIEGLHKKYNTDIVRTGPREISIASADAIPLIYGPMSKCRKGVWYSSAYHMEGASLQTTRVHQEHRERRKAWDRAFNAKSLRDYEPRVNRHTRLLIEKLKEQANEPSVRISSWIGFYAFDIMGDIGYNRGFGMLEKGEEDEMIELLHKSMAPLSIFGHIPWAINIITRTSLGAKDMITFIKLTQNILVERKKITPAEPDVFSHLIDDSKDEIPMELNADSRLVIVAGSDTTHATLTWLLWELCTHKDAQAKLRKITDEIAPSKSFLDAEDVANCPHLDGAINESLRLHPAVPSGLQRETPPSGITLPDGTYIPGETTVWMPIHTLQRDERSFAEPLRFMPERWTDEAPEYVKDKRAFIPFSTGVYSCIGQKLAMIEMRVVMANLLRSFEIDFAGDMGEAVVEKSRDAFTLSVGALDVKLTPRYKD